MSTQFDIDAARERYQSEESDALIRIAYAKSDEFVPEAVTLAREILRERGVEGPDNELVAITGAQVAKQDTERVERANTPLSWGYKVLCFIFADLFAILVALFHSANGWKRASREAWKWMGYGWVLRVVVIVGLMLSNR
jgi:hypothetical protein